jgi:hypothetical protein
MSFDSNNANKKLVINVVFTNHCFTRSYKHGEPINGMRLFDISTKRPRIFCPIRYRLSTELPRMIRDMNNGTVKVRETIARRNFVHSLKIEDPSGPYHIFIDVKKENGKVYDLKMFIESAYHEDTPPRTLGRIGFHILCTNKYLNKKTSTKR